MKNISAPVLIGGGVVLAALGLWWITRKGTAASVGEAAGTAAVDLVAGVVGGVAGGVADVANDPSMNPLEPVGAWVGSTFYDLTHSKENGGIW